MSIQVGDSIPQAALNYLQDGVKTLSTEELFNDSKVVLFAVPGAFTPTCSARHLPSYVEKMEEFRQRGIKVACMAVNDAFVMGAWGKQNQTPADLYMLADGNAEFTKALGLELDASGFGMGLRSKRFALYAENGVVKSLWLEAPGEFKVSSADHVLSNIAS